MKFESKPRKHKLKPIAVKYICGKCGVAQFCIIEKERVDCLSCTRTKCPNEEMYIYREERSGRLSCCIVGEELEKIKERIRNS